VHLPLTVIAILVLYNVTCYINIYEKLCKFLYIGLASHGCTSICFFFQNLNILCIFSDRFFDPVFFRFRFGSGLLGRPVRFW
jgi:hypothetical protein